MKKHIRRAARGRGRDGAVGRGALAELSFEGRVVARRPTPSARRSAGWWTGRGARGRHHRNRRPVATLETTKVYARRTASSAACSPSRATTPRASSSATARWLHRADKPLHRFRVHRKGVQQQRDEVRPHRRARVPFLHEGRHAHRHRRRDFRGRLRVGRRFRRRRRFFRQQRRHHFLYIGDHGRRVLHGRDRRHLPQPGL